MMMMNNISFFFLHYLGRTRAQEAMRGLEDEGEEEEVCDDDDQFDHTGRLSGFNDHLNTRRRLYEKSRKYSVDSESSDPLRDNDKYQIAYPHPSPSPLPSPHPGIAYEQSMMSPKRRTTTTTAAAAAAATTSVQNSIRSSASAQSGSSGNLKDTGTTGRESRNTDPVPQVLLRLQLDLR